MFGLLFLEKIPVETVVPNVLFVILLQEIDMANSPGFFLDIHFSWPQPSFYSKELDLTSEAIFRSSEAVSENFIR